MVAKRYETFFCDIDINWDSNFYHFIARLILVLNVLDILIWNGAGILLNHGDLTLSLEMVVYLLYNLLSVVKLSTFVCQEQKHRSLSEAADKLRRTNINDDQYVQTMHRVARLFAKGWNTLMITSSTLVTLVMLIQTPISMAKRELLFNGYYPYDVTASPYYELTVLTRTTIVFLNVGTYTVCDTSLIITLVNTIIQFKILRHNIRHVREHAVQNINEARLPRGLRSLVDAGIPAVGAAEVISRTGRGEESSTVVGVTANRWQQRALAASHVESRPHREGVLFDVEAQVERRRNTQQHEQLANSRPSGQSEADDTERSLYMEASLQAMKLAINREMETELMKCVKHHQHLIGFVGDLETAFNPFFIIQLFSNLVLTGAIAAYFLLVSELDIKIVILAVLFYCCVAELFIFCTLSSEITLESGSVKDSVYACDWRDASEGFKRSMRIVMSRSNEPIVMQAAWHVPLTMETFSNVCNTAYSYFMALRTVLSNK